MEFQSLILKYTQFGFHRRLQRPYIYYITLINEGCLHL